MSGPPVDALGEWVREAFGLGDAPALVTFVGRGAQARVWLLECDGGRYALKQPFGTWEEDVLCREATLLEAFVLAGIEVPMGLRDTAGRYAAVLPASLGGGQVRLTHWVDGEPLPTPATGLAGPLGTLLGRVHAAARPTDEVPGSWYTTAPEPDVWDGLVHLSAHQPWGSRLAGRHADLVALCELARSAGRARRHVISHRDLHPQNVLLTPAGELVALDWEDVGPIDPDRELAKVLVQWHVEVDVVDEDGARETLTAYRAAGGTGLLGDLDAFATVISTELNFLVGQVRAALDPGVPGELRAHAAAEIEDGLGYLPSVAALDRLVGIAASA